METGFAENAQTSWRQIAIEASRALACLDVERLEDLEQSCQVLNRDLPRKLKNNRVQAVREARQAAGAVATLAQVLDATRANLQVLYRLRRIQTGSDGYCSEHEHPGTAQESAHGHH